jgi:hypothetical protein
MRKFILVLGLAVLCLSFSATADDWGAPNPVSFTSRGFGYVAEVFPPRSRQNTTDKPLCYFYETGDSGGTAWKIAAKLKWKAPLVNDAMPYQAVVSTHGRLVTLNEYGALGYKNAVAIYGQTGALVKTYQLGELIPAAIARRSRHRCLRDGGTRKPSTTSWIIPVVFTSCCHGEKRWSFNWTQGGKGMDLPLNSASWPRSWQKGTTAMKKPKYGRQACGSLR